ncbi:MAG: hypothetical protein N2484_00730 [Clostridia bacterium]|nr:hypothetical protein [Clostridia bacterium]
MQDMIAIFGTFEGITRADFYSDGSLKECTLNEAVKIKTPYGVLLPQYADDGVRRKFSKSLSFYKNGNLKSISLHDQTYIKTPVGVFPAELITFYESGKIKRLFPLNGKITGYWTEENEYELAQEFDFSFSFGKFRSKIIGIRFYETGELKGITFWTRDVIGIQPPIGEMQIRIGVGLYPDGRLKSVEPRIPTAVDTPIGIIMAYNSGAIGIHGDANSLAFYEDGRVKSLITCTDYITVTDKNGKKKTFGPDMKPSLFHVGKMEIIPLCISFSDGKVRFSNEEESFEIEQYIFTVKSYPQILRAECGDCSSCTSCG